VCLWLPLTLTKVNKYRSPPGLGYFRIRRQAKHFQRKKNYVRSAAVLGPIGSQYPVALGLRLPEQF
jgi:hypothetical protein